MSKKIAVMTSGGDSPGMNAAVRAVVRNALFHGHEAYGARRGYQGILDGDFVKMSSKDVSNIIQRGGTILKSSRCLEMKTPEGLQKAVDSLNQHQIDAVVTVGGNGTYMGAHKLSERWQGQLIGLPGTIDNDIYGTEATIGFDTAVNTAMEAIDKIRDTADSHERFFLVEVMGRHAGFLAMDVGVAGGAEEVLVPETVTDLEAICRQLIDNKNKGKYSNIVVVAEGDEVGGAMAVSAKLKEMTGHDNRVVILGHMQRGGTPTAADRILASQLGAYSVELINEGKSGVALGRMGEKIVETPLLEASTHKKDLDAFTIKMITQIAG